MKRILFGAIVVAALAVGGWLGVNLYAQHRATAEVEATFEQIRASGGKASHGSIAFDLPSRTLTIEDIAVERFEPQNSIKIAGVKVVGVRQVDETRFSADSIEISGTEFAFEGAAGQMNVKAAYKVPQITVHDYSGAIRLQGSPASSSLIDHCRFTLDQFASITASSIAVPTIAVTINPGSKEPGSGDFTYSGVAMQNINRGKVDAAKVDRIVFNLNMQQPGRPDKLTSELSNLIINDFDATAVAAGLDPNKVDDDSYHRTYRQISAGPYLVTSAQGLRAQVDKITVDDIALRPSKFRLAEILALLPKDQSTPPTPAQAREALETFAGIYEGLRVGKVEIGNSSVDTPQGIAKLNAIRYDQGEIALEGLDAPSPQGQVRMERFALKSFSLVSLMRWAAQYTDPLQRPSPDKALGLFRVLAGVEAKGISAPYKNTKKFVTIDKLSLDWGQLVGPIPSKATLIAKMVAPTDPTNPSQMPLVAAGIDKIAIDLNVGAAWTESSGAFALEPLTVDIGNLARAQGRVALANVPRGVFSVDRAEAMSQAAQIEAGAIEFTLRDNGAGDLAVAQFARMQNVGRDAARQAILDSIRAQREHATSANPDAGAVVDAVAQFIATPGQTLVIKLTPLGKVPAMQLMQLLNNEPMAALAQFRIEASTGL